MEFYFNEKINLDYPVEKEFFIDKDIKNISIDAQAISKIDCLFYMWIFDPSGILRVQHLFKNTVDNFIISNNEKDCNKGVYPGNIESGIWKIVLFTEESDKYIEYKLKIKLNDEYCLDNDEYEKEFWVDYERENSILTLNKYDWNRRISNEKRWYRGDFHTHSNLSDGKMNGKIYIDTAKSMKLDFAVSTEHNIVPTSWCKSNDVLVIPGTEVTLKDGHFNIFGLEKFPNVKFDGSYEESVISILKEQRENRRSICSINHPMLEFWKWKFYNVELTYIDTWEICNDPTYYLAKESNDIAIKLLDILWNDGYRIWGIGGSDSHILPSETYDNSKDPSIIGDPCTYVYSDNLCAESILSHVHLGNVYVARGLSLELNIHDDEISYLPGNEVVIKNDKVVIEYGVKISENYWQNSKGLVTLEKETHHSYTFMGVSDSHQKQVLGSQFKEELKVLLIENGNIIEEKIIEDEEIIFKTVWKSNEFKYIRAEIRTLNNEFRAYINPIYHGIKPHTIKNFKQLLSKINIK